MGINVQQIVGGPAALTFNSVDLGSTIGGVVIKWNNEHNKVMVDQSTMPVKKLAKLKEASVEFVLAEASDANLQLALGSSTTGFGGNNATPEHALGVAGPGPNGGNRDFTFHKASVEGSSEYKNERGEVVGLKVVMECVADLTKNNDEQLFTWVST
jgi:hypothetical protein